MSGFPLRPALSLPSLNPSGRLNENGTFGRVFLPDRQLPSSQPLVPLSMPIITDDGIFRIPAVPPVTPSRAVVSSTPTEPATSLDRSPANDPSDDLDGNLDFCSEPPAESVKCVRTMDRLNIAPGTPSGSSSLHRHIPVSVSPVASRTRNGLVCKRKKKKKRSPGKKSPTSSPLGTQEGADSVNRNVDSSPSRDANNPISIGNSGTIVSAGAQNASPARQSGDNANMEIRSTPVFLNSSVRLPLASTPVNAALDGMGSFCVNEATESDNVSGAPPSQTELQRLSEPNLLTGSPSSERISSPGISIMYSDESQSSLREVFQTPPRLPDNARRQGSGRQERPNDVSSED